MILLRKTTTYSLLFSRLVLFMLFQWLVAVWLRSWEASQHYWLLTATLTNITGIIILLRLFRRQGQGFFRLFYFKRAGLGKDLLIFSGIFLLTVPVVFLPGQLLSDLLWDQADIPTAMMFGPLEPWLVYGLLIAFPVTIALAELATYFMVVMPNLRRMLRYPWLAVLLPVILLSFQHCTLPFIPDLRFIIYRALVFLPFALLIGIALYKRPSLFPYLAILHGLLDLGTGVMFVMQLPH